MDWAVDVLHRCVLLFRDQNIHFLLVWFGILQQRLQNAFNIYFWKQDANGSKGYIFKHGPQVSLSSSSSNER